MSASECAAAAMGVQTAAAAVAAALHGLEETDEPPPKRRKKKQRPAAAKAATATEIPGSSLNFPQAEAALRVDEGGHGQGGGAAGRDLPAGSEV